MIISARYELPRCIAYVQCAVAHVRVFWKVCGICVRAALFWACDVRSHFCTLLHIFWGQNCQKTLHFRTPFPALERPFLFWIILFCFRMSYSVLEHTKPKNVEKLLKKVWKIDAHLNLDVRSACMRPKKHSQLTPWPSVMPWRSIKVICYFV